MTHVDVDRIAQKLSRFGRLAHKMPPAWRGAGIHHPCSGLEGQVIGRILPGKGLYLDCDLKHLGITKKVPYVVERSPMRRLLDLAMSEAAAITTLQGVQQAIQSGKGQLTFGIYTGALGSYANVPQWTDSYQAQNILAGRTKYPAAPNGAVMTQASARALNTTMIAPAGSNTEYLIGFGVGHSGGTPPSGEAMYVIMDVLIGLGSIGNNVTTSIPLTPPALTRYTSGAGVLALIEQETAVVPVGDITLTYTNQAGTPSQTATCNTPSFTVNPGGSTVGDPTADALALPFLPLASGDYGIQSVSAIQWTQAQGAAQTACVMLYYPLMFISGSVATNDYFESDTTSAIHGLVPLQVASGLLGCLEVLAYDDLPNFPTNTFTLFKTVQG
jgi:hypothetical protein